MNILLLKKLRYVCLWAICTSLPAFAEKQPDTRVVTPNPLQKEWAEAEIGVIIHFDMPVYAPEYNWRNWGTRPDASVFNPTGLNTDQWIETAKRMGAKYAILVAKHCSGFSLWPTEAHEYSIKNSPYKNGKGDIVKDFITSCRKYGLKPGIYASTTANGYLHVDNPGLVQKSSPVTQEEYNKIVTQQLTELWSRYGKLFEIWFDGGVLAKERGGADILSLVKKLQPEAIAFQGPFGHPNLIRWVGNEEGTSPYPCWATAHSTTKADGTKVIKGLNGDPAASHWCPGEADFTLRKNNSFQGGWFWHANEDDRIFTIDQLMQKYITSVGRNTNMLIGLVVDNRGLIPDADVAAAEAYGKEIQKRFGKPRRQVSGSGKQFTITIPVQTSVNYVVLQEDIAKGERVLEYTLEGKKDGTWVKLASGTCIGHKRIEEIHRTDLEAVRLEILQCKDKPEIKSFAIY